MLLKIHSTHPQPLGRVVFFTNETFDGRLKCGGLLKHTNAWRNRIGERSHGLTHVVLGLQVKPKAGLPVEKQPQTQGGIGRHGAVAIDQIADSAGRHINVSDN